MRTSDIAAIALGISAVALGAGMWLLDQRVSALELRWHNEPPVMRTTTFYYSEKPAQRIERINLGMNRYPGGYRLDASKRPANQAASSTR